MNVIRKDATIENTGDDDAFPGSFEVVLSTPDRDRDGDELAIEDWKQPLPEHITFDMDHGMSVEKTVGSGVPSIEDGRLVVRGTYSSLPRAQEVRTLVKEGHIRTTSVAFSSSKVTKDGRSRTERELLNGAFVAIPANPNARVLSAKAGARNSASDQQHIQDAHDSLVAIGADCGPMDDTGASEGATGGKSMSELRARLEAIRKGIAADREALVAQFGLKAKYDAEILRQMLDKGEAIENANGEPSYPIGDKEDLENAIHAVGRGQGDHDKIRAYIIRRAKDLDASDLIPDNWGTDGSMKAASGTEVKALGPNDQVSVNVCGSAGGFDISVNAWCVPADELDAYADTAQRALAAALGIASEGPVDDDDDEAAAVDAGDNTGDTKNLAEGTASGSAAPSGAAAKSGDAEALALEARLLALQVIASAAD